MSFSNNSSQKERAAILRNEQRLRNEQATTFHSFATSEADAVGGRFARATQSNVIGSSPVSYPRLPSNGPWSDADPSGPEAPYPIDLSEPPEPVGTAAEIEASLDADLGLERMLRNPNRDRPNTSASPVCGGVAGDDVAAAPTSLGVSSPTSLSKSRTASEDGVPNSNQGGRGGASSSKSPLRRRLR